MDDTFRCERRTLAVLAGSIRSVEPDATRIATSGRGPTDSVKDERARPPGVDSQAASD
jgi:hypothetical protein